MDQVTEIVEYKDDAKNLDIRLVISESNVEIGMYRMMLLKVAEAEEIAKAFDAGDIRANGLAILHTRIYPDLIAAVTEATGFEKWPISFDEFKQLPEPLEAAWEEVVYKVNKHWLPNFETVEQTEKKVLTPTPASSSARTRKRK